MQAAATRPAGAPRLRRTDRLNATPHLTVVDELGLLDALPIAAAVIVFINRRQMFQRGAGVTEVLGSEEKE